MTDLLQDVRYAVRALLRAPGFTAAAVGTLALGIGATTAVFSLTHEALFTPPAVQAPERLAMMYTTSSSGAPRSASSYPDYSDARARIGALADVAAYSWVPLSVGGDSDAGLATGQLVTGNYFNVTGVRAALGRALLPTDDARGAPQLVAMLSDAFWRRRFGGAAAAVGATLRLNGVSFTVVGVLTPEFRGLTAGRGADVWLPMQAGALLGEGVGAAATPNIFDTRGARYLAGMVGRLASGATLEQARAAMAVLSDQLALVDTLRGNRGFTVDALSRRILPNGAEGDIARFLLLLLGVVGSTLLLASSNLANLLLARASTRQREMGIRVALGAGRARLVRQLLTESAVLALLGAVVGVVIAVFALDLLGGFALPGGLLVRDLAVHIDARLLIAALVCAAGSALLFGLVPALQTTRTPLVTALRGDAASVSGGVIRRWLVAAQVALSLVLLVGSALFLRTLERALVFDPGFRADGVTVARFSLSLLGYDEAARGAFVDRLLASTARLPGVQRGAVTAGTLVPFQAGGHRGMRADPQGYQPTRDESMRVDLVSVAPHYFDVLDIPIVRGRAITEADRRGSHPVAVISRSAAERWWRGREPVGSTVRIGGPPGQDYEVIGVAGDVVWEELSDAPTPYIFLALAQSAPASSVTLAVRSSAAPGAVAAALRSEFRTLDPDLAMMALGPLADWVDAQIAPQRVAATLLTFFGLLAVVIAALGIYGIVSFAVARQTRAIGVRIALGAPRAHVAALVARSVAAPVAAGLAAGLAGSWALAGTLRRFLFGIDPHDPLTLLGVALILSAVAAVATLGPTLRAARIAPMEALRHE